MIFQKKNNFLYLFILLALMSCNNKQPEILSEDYINDYVDLLFIEKLYTTNKKLARKKLTEKLKDSSFSLKDFKKNISFKKDPDILTIFRNKVFDELNNRIEQYNKPNKRKKDDKQ